MGSKIKTEFITVAPDLAAQWPLKNRVQNRRISPARVKEYAEKMKKGEWKLTTQGISFSEDGDAS